MTTTGKMIIVTKYYCVCSINIYSIVHIYIYMYSTKKEEGVEPYKSNVSKIRMVNLSNH